MPWSRCRATADRRRRRRCRPCAAAAASPTHGVTRPCHWRVAAAAFRHVCVCVHVACCMHTCEVADVWWRQPAEVGEGRCQRPRQRSSHWSNSTSVVLSWTWARRAVSAVHAAGAPVGVRQPIHSQFRHLWSDLVTLWSVTLMTYLVT